MASRWTPEATKALARAGHGATIPAMPVGDDVLTRGAGPAAPTEESVTMAQSASNCSRPAAALAPCQARQAHVVVGRVLLTEPDRQTGTYGVGGLPVTGVPTATRVRTAGPSSATNQRSRLKKESDAPAAGGATRSRACRCRHGAHSMFVTHFQSPP